jgi:hypothetical protein
MPSTVARRLLPVLLLLVCGACGGQNPYQAAESAASSPEVTAPATTDSSFNDNQYLPARQNVSDCIGAVERPNCGSEAKGGWQMYLAFGVLIAGMSFIGWRVVRSVRARDAAMLE